MIALIIVIIRVSGIITIIITARTANTIITIAGIIIINITTNTTDDVAFTEIRLPPCTM